MYKFERYRQLGRVDFNQPVGLKMNLENRWVKKAATIPQDAVEDKYANDYLNLAKCKKRTAKKIRKAIKQQLQYVRRDFGYVEWMLDEGAELSAKRRQRYEVLRAVYKQQKYMYKNKVHTVPNCTASAFPVLRWADRRKAPWQTRRANTLTMPTESRLKDPSAWPKGAMDLAGS